MQAAQWKAIMPRLIGPSLFTLALMAVSASATGQFGTPKGEEGVRIFTAAEHPYYSGQFRLSGHKATLIGSMNDRTPWDHLDYSGKRLTPVQGTIDIDVNELTNNGRVAAEFVEGSDRYRIVFDRFAAKAAFQNGGIATRLYNMAIPATAIRSILKPGSTLEDGARPRYPKTIRFFIRTMMLTSW
jgi:hypothetical protein